MGLDAVELLLAAEEKFWIHIHDADASNLTTPRMMVDYVYSCVRNTEDRSCTSQIGFYRFRSVLVNSFGEPRKNVYPDSHFARDLGLG